MGQGRDRRGWLLPGHVQLWGCCAANWLCHSPALRVCAELGVIQA